jgi:nicotinate-nucleotide adenylyltransferase
MSARDRVLLFGGSFDPVHHGHLIVARHVAEQFEIGRVVLIPSRTPPHKPIVALAEIEHRLAMCRLAVEGDTLFEVSDWEARRSGPNYTLLTVEHFRREMGGRVELCWLIGMDSLHELHTWHRAAELVAACTIVTAARPGYSSPTVEQLAGRFSASAAEQLVNRIVSSRQIDISSTDIRMRVGAGAGIRYLVPPAVEGYIRDNRLYG